MVEGGSRTRGEKKSGTSLNPLVSVITVVRNGAASIEKTMTAVLGQTYPNLEYIVVDGASSDGTVDLLRRFDDRIAYWISEPDKGLYDAMNKGDAMVKDSDSYVM